MYYLRNNKKTRINQVLSMTHQRYFFTLSLIFFVVFILLAISPHDRADWALENALVLVFAIVLGSSYKVFPLSRISYTLIFIFLCLHEVGAHYTYAMVPYDQFIMNNFGFSLNEVLGWERNNFDRAVHFSYGLLLAYPIREFYVRVAGTTGFWGYFFPLELTMASSMMFELFEWGAAELFGGELGVAYLGTQGDIWDAHKDMALASLGALIAMIITLFINIKLQKSFAAEWDFSLSIKGRQPLGEDEIERIRKSRKD
jgi:putative membrane protein